MRIDRKILKQNAKQMMRETQPAVWSVTLVYLLLTVVLTQLVDLFDPVTAQRQELYSKMLDALMRNDVNIAAQISQQINTLNAGGSPLGFVYIVLALFTFVMTYGYTNYAMKVVRGEESGFGDLFSRFYMAGKIIGAQVLQIVFCMLWMLLGMVPILVATVAIGGPGQSMGIILIGVTASMIVGTVLTFMALYRYRMIVYCLLDDDECRIMEAFRRSKDMMYGRKWELFVLDFSFIGWILLALAIATAVESVLFMLPYTIRGLMSIAAYVACYCFLTPYILFTQTQWYLEVCPQPEPEEEQDIDHDELY